MALNYQKFQKLKIWNEVISHNARESDKYKSIEKDYFSDTGLTQSDIYERVRRLNSCCDTIEVSVDSKKNEYVQKANFCRAHCVCPLCASRVQVMRRRRYLPHIKAAAEKYQNAYMLTFTLAGRENLSGMVQHLTESIRRFRKKGQKRQTRAGRRTHSRGEWSKVAGAIISQEIKRGKRSGLWHVHAHALVFTDIPLDFRLGYDTVNYGGKNIDVSKIQKEWYEATQGQGLNIRVDKMGHIPKRATARKKRRLAKMKLSDSIAEQSKEVLKYTSKLNPSKSGDIIDILIHTHYKRLFSSTGVFYGLGTDDYSLQTRDRVTSYYATWNTSRGEYQLCRAHNQNEYPSIDPPLKTAQSEAAQLLGEYKRQRKRILLSGISGIAFHLDKEKKAYREKVSAIWSDYYNWRILDRANLKTTGRQLEMAV